MRPTGPIPTRVIGGRYIVLGELGRGGMGIVWRAEDRVMGRQVAVKELHLPEGLSPDERNLFRERLLREARNAGRLNDPGIVTVHDVITDSGVDHIVMELIEALTLAEVVTATGPIDERSAVAIAQQLLAALQTAHVSGVVHRDVKPSNVMLGPGTRVRLTDFGIAQAADDPRLTSTGSMVGSPAYMAPERLEGGMATPASDLWSLGATLFLAVQGSGPFTRETTAATIFAVTFAELPPLRTRGPLGSVITGLLQRAPEARLSAVQASALLASPQSQPLLGGGEITGPGATRTGQAIPARARRWWPWAGAALVLGVVLGLVGGLLGPRLGAREVPVFSYGDGGDLPIFDISAGYCLSSQLAPGRAFPSSAYIDCDSPHDVEVFAAFDPFDSSRVLPYPGVDQLAGYARPACTLIFDSALIEGADKARLQVVGVVPSAVSFTTSTSSSFGGRTVLCALRVADGSQLTGTRISTATS